MKSNTYLKLFWTFGVAVGLAGCSTPKIALESANHGTKLMSLLDAQLKEFRQVQEVAEQSRIASLKLQKDMLLKVGIASQLDIAASKSAGDTTKEPLAKRMLADAEGVSAIQAKALSSKETNDQKLSTLLSPLPSTTAAITSAQTKLAEMGVDTSKKTRFEELLVFAKDIKTNVTENKKKIKDAQEAATKTDAGVKSDVEKEAPASP